MATQKPGEEEYTVRATAQDSDSNLRLLRRTAEAEPSSVPSQEPRVYGGTISHPSQGAIVGDMIAARNRKTSRRPVSPFNLMLILIATAVVIVLYISNIIAIGQLMNEIDVLQQRYRRISNEQEIFKAQINRLSSLERIRKLAEDDLGLRNPKDLPIWLSVDREKLKALDASAPQLKKRPKK